MAEASPSHRSPSVAFALGQLTERVDATKTAVEDLPQTIMPRFDKLEVRVTAIEQKQWMWLGGGTVLMGIVSIFVGHTVK
jgi:hypothetical protein